jgi:tetratricopeptide (TPR) repeat protein
MSVAVSMVFVLQPAQGQKPGGGAAPGAGGGTTARKTSPTPSTSPDTTRQPVYPADTLNRGLFLSGKVQMDDGTPPPESVVIERNCNGYSRAEGYTDSKGHFSFQLGQTNAVTQDASYDELDPNRISQNNGTRQNTAASRQGSPSASRPVFAQQDLAGCEIRAVLAGFRSDAVNLSGRRMFDNPDVGTIVLHRMTNVEGTTISATTLAAPKDARKAYEKARDALRKGKTSEAEKEFDKAVAAYPQFAAAWNSLGEIHERSREVADARRCYSQALASDPKLVTPYLHLARLSLAEKNWQDVAATTGRLIKLDAYDFPEAYFYNAVAGYNLHKYDEALASAREAQKLDTAHKFPKVEQLLGLVLYQKRDYAGAAEQMRKYLLLAPDTPDAAQVKQQIAELERFMGEEAKAKADQPPQ